MDRSSDGKPNYGSGYISMSSGITNNISKDQSASSLVTARLCHISPCIK